MPKTITRKNIIPKTGQLTSYANYDDGYYQKGSPILPRFIDLGKNTILDRVMNVEWFNRPELIIPTGLNADDVVVEKGDWISATSYAAGDLVTDPNDSNAYICLIANDHSADDFATERSNNPTYWQQSAWAISNGSGGVNPTQVVWDVSYGANNALDMCHAINKGGKSDWKLPNVKELISLVDYGRVSPAIDPLFTNCRTDNYYWSSTVYADNSGYPWIVNFNGGGVGNGFRGNSYYVRPCRQY